jgi:hypothetical protein
MLILKLQVNHNMTERYPDKPPEEKYRLILSRGAANMSLYFYFTREELFNFADEIVNLVSRLPTLENDPSLTGFESVINDTQHVPQLPVNSDNTPTVKTTKIPPALGRPRNKPTQ